MINKPNNWNDFEESEVVESLALVAGPYPVQIKNVIDFAEKEYLEIQFDIVKDKKYSGYFSQMQENLKLDKWPNQGIYRASYKETATKFFKAFITAVQKSNQGYVWDWNPQSLRGKYLIMNFGEEEKNILDLETENRNLKNQMLDAEFRVAEAEIQNSLLNEEISNISEL